jgi:hypothetical protein
MLRSAREIHPIGCRVRDARRRAAVADNAIADRCAPLSLPRGGVTAHQHRSHGLSHPAIASKNCSSSSIAW